MSAAFAELVNSSDKDVRVVSATSPASARVELHEIVTGDGRDDTMRPKDGGFRVLRTGPPALPRAATT